MKAIHRKPCKEMNLRVTFTLRTDEISLLAYRSGCLRDDPQKAWTCKEQEDHARRKIGKLVREYLDSMM